MSNGGTPIVRFQRLTVLDNKPIFIFESDIDKVTYGVTLEDLATNLAPFIDPGQATWGSIIGTLSNQVDLQAALNAKLNLNGGSMTGPVVSVSTWQGVSFNGVVLTTGGFAANKLDETGAYSAVNWGQLSGTLSDQTDLLSALNAKKNDFSENTAFNKNFGTSAGTVLEGDTVLGGAVDSVTGDGVGGTAVNPVMSFPAPSDIGLGNIDNTSDANKPVSTAQQTALDLKLNLSGGAMTGPVTSSSTWAGTSFNGVVLTTGAGSSNALNGAGNYVAFVAAVSDGDNISVDNTDPNNPIINQILPKVLSDNPIDVNTTTSMLDKINDTFVGNKAGDYRVHFETNQSYDASNSSIIFEAEIDGTLQGTSDEVFRMEPQDSGGNDGDGRGTSQKHVFKQSYPFTLASDGDIDVRFAFATSVGGVEAAMWNTSIRLEKVENV
ncbi:hypothetical protein KAR91_25145 [Candidatus Pacearchaeota archaeon]|nr:hypothetical protein [Candidatus Pacearchaeota archaeon]